MPFGVIGRTGPGMRQVVGFGIGSWKGVLLGANFGRAIVTNWDFTASLCDSAATRSSSQITFGKLVCLAYRRNRTKRHYEKLNARGRMSSAKQTVQEDLCQFEATCVQSLYVMLAFVLFLRIKPWLDCQTRPDSTQLALQFSDHSESGVVVSGHWTDQLIWVVSSDLITALQSSSRILIVLGLSHLSSLQRLLSVILRIVNIISL